MRRYINFQKDSPLQFNIYIRSEHRLSQFF